MAYALLTKGECPDFQTMEGGIITVNTETASTLGLDYSPLGAMADTLKEVTTE